MSKMIASYYSSGKNPIEIPRSVMGERGIVSITHPAMVQITKLFNGFFSMFSEANNNIHQIEITLLGASLILYIFLLSAMLYIRMCVVQMILTEFIYPCR